MSHLFLFFMYQAQPKLPPVAHLMHSSMRGGIAQSGDSSVGSKSSDTVRTW